MSTYRLDETPEIFLSGVVKEGSYIFRLNIIEPHTHLCDIDLWKDRLIVYGTEIDDSNREKLHQSLILRQDVGKLCVNCNGACYIFLIDKFVYYRPIQNVIFDWSLFGVKVPNSVQQQKETELEKISSLLCSAKDEAKANKDGWEAAKIEIEKLKKDLSKCGKQKKDEKIEQEEVKNQLLSSKKDNKCLGLELQIMVQRQVSSTVFELLKTSKIMDRVAALEERGEVRKVEDRVSLIEKELDSTRTDQESTKKSVEELDSLISSCKKENEVIFAKLEKMKNQSSSENKMTCEKVHDHFSLIMNELQNIKYLMSFTPEMELED
uniref:Uncharacterized protein n=1 Tax=Chenopodium quinoa TaxID=63459 RepID=A0A803N061_CHEQI